MSSEMTRPAAEQVIRWMEDSPKVFEGVRREVAVLVEYPAKAREDRRTVFYPPKQPRLLGSR